MNMKNDFSTLYKYAQVFAQSTLIKTACVVASGTFSGDFCLLKDRDRNYVPKLKIVRDMINDIEVAYIIDTGTNWSEGMNEYGVGAINAALSVGHDENEKKLIKKDVKKKSKDGKAMIDLLGFPDARSAISVLREIRLIPGHTILADDHLALSIESTNRKAFIKQINKEKIAVRTNHGLADPNLGYTEGKKHLSSVARRNKAIKVLSEVNLPEDLAPALVRARLKDHHSILNPVRDTEQMSTTSQLVLNLTKRHMMLWLIPDKVEFLGIENKLPKDYEPKIKIDVFKYENMNKDDPDYKLISP
jgi:hypothetical protein